MNTRAFIAAFKGHLDCLIFAHMLKFPWDKRVTLVAAREGHIDCFMYACANGCEINKLDCLTVAIEKKRGDFIMYIMNI